MMLFFPNSISLVTEPSAKLNRAQRDADLRVSSLWTIGNSSQLMRPIAGPRKANSSLPLP